MLTSLPGNTGLGKESALQLAKCNTSVFITSRDPQRGDQAITELNSLVPDAKIKLVIVDLESLASVRGGVAQFLAQASRLDILMNNAVVMVILVGLTKDGYEN